MEINRWWYSEKQKERSVEMNRFHNRQVFVNGKWHEYTEWTSSLNGKSNWEDAVLIAESTTKLPIMINGVRQ
jgi:hypothetical protein